MFEFYRRSFSNFFNRQDAGCLNKYYTVKSDIERQIDTFNKIKGKKVHTEWDRLNALIINTDKELKDCYERGYVKVKLNDEEKIKKFKNRCNRDSTCNNRAAPVTKPTITKALAQKTCDKGEECKNETPATVDIKSKSKLPSGAANPQSSERKVSQEQGQNQADVQKSRQESVIPQSLSGSTPSGDSVRTNDKTSQEIVDQHSTTSVVVKTQALPLNASSPSRISELGSPPSQPYSQCISGETSDLACTSTRKHLDINVIQTNQDSGNPLDTSNPEIQDSPGKVDVAQTRGFQDVSKGRSEGLAPTNRISGSGQHIHEDSLHTTTSGTGIDTVAPGNLNTDSSEVNNAAPRDIPSGHVGTNSMTSVDGPSYNRTSDSEDNRAQSFRSEGNVVEFSKGSSSDSQDAPVIGSRVQVPDHITSCREGATFAGNDNGMSCNAEPVGELNEVKLDMLGKVINAIQNNPQIIKTSMPIGIVLLLGLLFKYTPLWRVLTKKNRKKGSGINEELNSVLQEPSIMDDERSIPFSYGAFEYSSFDQNVY
ncbi:PIR protein [Plasmodium vivax]|nr:PIR protein [Plasmodium vivax]